MQQRQSVVVGVSGAGPAILQGLVGKLLVSQSVMPSKKQLGGAKLFVFTERLVEEMARILEN